MFEVKKAKRSRRPLKINLEGLSGSGKTYTALRLAFAMRRAGIGKRIVVADSENESAGLYDGIKIDGEKWEYEVCPVPAEKQNPLGYSECYEYLVTQRFDIIIMDSMTHAWKGALQKVDEVTARSRSKNTFGEGWKTVTPEQEKMLRTLTDTRAHLIATTRVKGDYEMVQGSNGKMQPKKMGMKADQRDGLEYEFDVVVRLDPEEHAAHVEKVRGCTALDGKVGKCPGPEFWKPLFDWWLSAEPAKEEPKQPPPPKTSPKTPGSIIKSMQEARTQSDFDQACADAKDNWPNFNPMGRTAFLEAKAATAARLEKPAPDRNAIFPAMTRLASATGIPIDKLMQDLADEFAIGALDDMAPEQVTPVLEWIAEKMPKGKVA